MDEAVVQRLKEEKIIRAARTDVNAFAEYVLRDAKTGERVRQAEIHLSWQAHIDWCWGQHKRAGIMAPWGHGKTGQMISRTLFEIGNNRSIRCKVVCNVDQQAAGRVSTMKNYIEYSREYHRVFPDIKPNFDEWAAHQFSVVRPVASPDSTLEAHGVLSTGIGGRADLIFFDDPVDRKNAIAEPRKQLQVIESFYDTWMSRLEPDGRAAMICTRWTMTDLITELLKNPEWIWLIQRISKDYGHIEEEVVCAA